MEEREFAKYAFLIVAVVAVVGLLTMGDGITGFAAKKSYSKKPMIQKYAQPAAATAGDAGYPPEAKAKATAQVRTPRRGSCQDNEQGSGLDIAGNITFTNVSGERKVFNDLCGLENWMNDQSVADAGGATRPNEVLERYCEGSSIAVRWWTRCEAGCLNHNGACGQ